MAARFVIPSDKLQRPAWAAKVENVEIWLQCLQKAWDTFLRSAWVSKLHREELAAMLTKPSDTLLRSTRVSKLEHSETWLPF